jgi:hypothetical protein
MMRITMKRKKKRRRKVLLHTKKGLLFVHHFLHPVVGVVEFFSVFTKFVVRIS